MVPAHRTVRVSSELHLTELHAQGIEKHQATAENKSGDGLRSSEYRYLTPDNLVDVTYVEGVLVRYAISSR